MVDDITVKDLIDLLKQCPQDIPVKVIYDYYEFANRGIVCAGIKEICMSDDTVYIDLRDND